jgi:hypothetical protein
VVRYFDLVVLAIALPVFVAASFPMLGYVVGGAAWILARGLGLVADRRAARALRAGDRRQALGIVAGATLGRVWLVALAVLLVGLLADREDGLAAAVLALALVTAHMAGLFVARMFGTEEPA